MNNAGWGRIFAIAALIALIFIAGLREEANGAGSGRASAAARRSEQSISDAEFFKDFIRMILIGVGVAAIIALGFWIYYA